MNRKETVQSGSGGIGFLGMLAILFIGLKLTNFIDWSWVWVLAPLWIPFAIVLVILGGLGIILGVSYITDKKNK